MMAPPLRRIIERSFSGARGDRHIAPCLHSPCCRETQLGSPSAEELGCLASYTVLVAVAVIVVVIAAVVVVTVEAVMA